MKTDMNLKTHASVKDKSVLFEDIVSSPITLMVKSFSDKPLSEIGMDPTVEGFDPLYMAPEVPVRCGICPLGLVGLLSDGKLFNSFIEVIPKERLKEISGSDLANQVLYWCAVGGNRRIIDKWMSLVDTDIEFAWGLLQNKQPRSIQEAFIHKGNEDLLAHLDKVENTKDQTSQYKSLKDLEYKREKAIHHLQSEGIEVSSSAQVPRSQAEKAKSIIRKHL